ncbi:RNA polymerase sigma factor [Flagellimonas sp.]|jgi:RNA polymerase sigma factor (sigma-70 family)|uniref:RNA polymerase sigma factor n=1 Tax=Flagellimonas sp. TaxID=2058762 RepID=UPI003BAB8889|tara:strand:+ start:49 stop:612 length:564 start_codon:yes stop_codon:yes gene_type:complete
MTDQELLRQLKSGNEECLGQLYAHLGMVKSWICRNNGNEEDALDVFQEAIIIFYKNVMSGKYEQRSKISTYLFEISKRQWLNQLNRRKRHEQPREANGFESKFEEELIYEVTHRGPRLKDYLGRAMSRLGEPCKSLLETAIFLGMRMEDIAERFNYSSARSASQQKLRCLKKLRSSISYEDIIALEQ